MAINKRDLLSKPERMPTTREEVMAIFERNPDQAYSGSELLETLEAGGHYSSSTATPVRLMRTAGLSGALNELVREGKLAAHTPNLEERHYFLPG